MEAWKDPNTIVLWLVIIIAFIVILLSTIIIFVRLNFKKIIETEQKTAALKLQYQNELLESSIKVQERERSRIASDLHDDLIGKLSAIRFINKTQNQVDKLDSLMEESITSARRICHDLRPPLINYTSLADLFNEVIDPWRIKYVIQYTKDLRSVQLLPSDLKINLLRIFQEILTNIVKHSEAKKISIHLRHTNKWVILQVVDDGKGFDMEKRKSGLGLQNIEIRQKYIQGVYKIKSEIKKGTHFIFMAPCHLLVE